MRLISSHLKRTSLLLGLALLLTACGFSQESSSTENNISQSETQSTESEAESLSETASETALEPEVNDNDLAWEKVGDYLECINEFSVRMYETRSYYHSFLYSETGPTGEETYVRIYEIYSDPAACIAKIESANKIDFENQLNDLASAYGQALETLVPVINQAREYYELENYKDDDFAKGKEMHGVLMAAFEAFEQADVALGNALEPILDRLDQEWLKELEESGDRLGYLQQKLMMDAEDVIDLANVATIDELNLEQFTTALDVYETALSDLDKYESENESEINLILLYGSFDDATQAFLKASKDVMREKRDVANTDRETSDDLLDEMFDTYNHLIDKSNSL